MISHQYFKKDETEKKKIEIERSTREKDWPLKRNYLSHINLLKELVLEIGDW
jgi:hypothetical protein